jgi:hypothetical protein
MNDPSIKEVFYTSFERFLDQTSILSQDTILLVDEFHELFFNKEARVVGGRLISVVAKLQVACKLIGVSATFRGSGGKKKITTIFPGAVFINSPLEIQERILDLQVIGGTPSAEIFSKATLICQ